jgi:uncharacterized protein (TIGR02145 family)
MIPVIGNYIMNQLFLPVLTDFHGNTYSTVKIGNQIWTTKSVIATKFLNGDTITTGTTNASCTGTFDTAASSRTISQGSIKLFNGYAASDSRGLVNLPSGFRLPSSADWTTLKNFCNSSSSKLKSLSYPAGADNPDPTDEFGFGGLVGACGCGLITTTSFFWTTDVQYFQFNNINDIMQNTTGAMGGIGHQIRYVKDA